LDLLPKVAYNWALALEIGLIVRRREFIAGLGGAVAGALPLVVRSRRAGFRRSVCYGTPATPVAGFGFAYRPKAKQALMAA
jgi:hypothetical protein